MSLRPMSQHEVETYHFVPQLVLSQPTSFFTSKGVNFRRGYDDLDDFEVAELSLGNHLPFALLKYRGTPEDETTVFLPDKFGLPDLPILIEQITAAFGLSAAAVRWQRTRSDTPY